MLRLDPSGLYDQVRETIMALGMEPVRRPGSVRETARAV